MNQAQPTPLRMFLLIAALAWFLPLAAWLFVQYESGYFSTPPGELKDDRDQGFRLMQQDTNRGERRCPSVSPAWFGPCGMIEKSSLRDFLLNEYNADGLSLTDVQVDRVLWEWVSMQNARWTRTKVRRTELNDVDLSYSKLQNVEVRGGAWRGGRIDFAVLEDVDVVNTYMEDVSFRGVHFRKVHFNGTCIRCDFREAVFEGSTIEGNFLNSSYNENSVLPFPLDEIGVRRFRYVP